MTDSSITPSSRLRATEDTMCRELDGELVFLQLETQAYFGLDAVGARIWEALSETDTVDEAIGVLEEEFEVDRATLERDVLALAQKLVAKKLLAVE